MANLKSFSVLLGEDDSGDRRAMSRILDRLNFDVELEDYAYGNKIVDRVLKIGEFSNLDLAPPNLIILDVGLPGLSGIEVLERLRSIEETVHIPILMCSGSSSLRDFNRCQALGCNGYIQKNMELKTFSHVCSLFIEGWYHTANSEFY